MKILANYFFLACFFILFFANLSLAQECGTSVPKSHKLDPPLMPNSNKEIIEYNVNKTLSVYVWTVASAYETYDWSLPNYQADFDELNTIFEPINLRFALCVEDSIPNYNYNILWEEPDVDTGNRESDDMRSQHYVEDVINVYYVQSIPETPSEIAKAGFAFFPGGPDAIVLTKGSGIGTLAHEMGHFLGLYHTFEQDLGLENVNGDNCQITGDLVCDTDANFPDSGYDDGACVFTDLSTDANGEYYTPQLNNWMSYFGDCRGTFTNGQFNRMAFMYLNQRNYLW